MTTDTSLRFPVRDTGDGPANIIWYLEDRLRIAHGENLALRVLLAEHGVEAPAPDGVVSLLRLQRLENVLDLAKLYIRERDPAVERELHDAIMDAGRAP